MNKITEEFKKLGMSASYHYADDSGKEWRLADSDKKQALELFDNNPDLQDEMRTAARGFLWSLKQSRPEADK